MTGIEPRPQHNPEAFNRKIRHAIKGKAGVRKAAKAENARMMRRARRAANREVLAELG